MQDTRTYLATPATQVLMALREALFAVKEETMEKRWARHRRLGELARGKLSEWGFKFVADEDCRADTLTSFWIKDVVAESVQKRLQEKNGIVIARGLSDTKDKMLRIGHFGILTPRRLFEATQSLGEVLGEMGIRNG